MRNLALILTSVLVVLVFPSAAYAQVQGSQVVLPAGTLLRCTLDEPNFSSKTADVGTPVVCALSGLTMFNSVVFPRGAYVAGRLAADKDPGHFVGKGYLELEFDHISLPDGPVPMPSRMIGASGYKVDKQGKIIGHGHATRDAVEWMIPPLWPLKVIMLPARGPRPTLKGEERLTLRLMDDVPVPARPLPRWPYLQDPSSEDLPQRYDPASTEDAVPPNIPASARPLTSNNSRVAAGSQSDLLPGGSGAGVPQNVLVLLNGKSYPITGLHTEGDRVTYTLGDGSLGAVSLDEVDWTKTFQNNTENNKALAVSDSNPRR
jgi:hypothetical protein